MNNKRFLVVSDYLFSEVQGGAARTSSELAKELSLRGHKILMFLRGLPYGEGFEKNEYFEIYRYKRDLIRLVKILDKIFSEAPVDLVNFHDPYTAFFVRLYMFFDGKKIPVLYTFQSPWDSEYKIRASKKGLSKIRIFCGAFLRKLAEKFLLKTSDKVIAASRFMAEKLAEEHGIKAEIIPLGVDLKKFKFSDSSQREKIRVRLGFPSEKKIFFTLRNLEPRMGLENLVEAFKILKDKPGKIPFLIIGGRGSMEAELKEKVSACGLNADIKFAGYITDDDLPDYYALADAFVLPTRELEGFGLVVIEAMACGCPVLATPVAANKEVAGAFPGNFIFKGTAPEDMTAGFEVFLSKKEEELSRRACRQYAEKNFSWKKYAVGIEKIAYELSDM